MFQSGAANKSQAEIRGRLIVTAHDEGLLIRNSLEKLIKDASTLELRLQVEYFLDLASPLTTSQIIESGVMHRHLSFGDVAKARNLAFDTRSSEFAIIGFLDGDDWLESGWIAKVLNEAHNQLPGTTFVPSRRVLFWSQSPIRLSFLQPDSSFIPRKLLLSLQRSTNLWASAVFVYEPTATLRYRTTDTSHLFEDWWFVNDLLEAKADIKSIDGSLFYCQRTGRRKSQNSAEKSGYFLSPRGDPSFLKKLIGLVVLACTFRPIESLRLSIQCLLRSNIYHSEN